MRRLLLILISMSGLAISQQTGLVETSDVDLSYEVYGSQSSATPVIVANGGPDVQVVDEFLGKP